MHVCACISKDYFFCLCDKIPEKNLKTGGLGSDSQFEGKMHHGRQESMAREGHCAPELSSLSLFQ